MFFYPKHFSFCLNLEDEKLQSCHSYLEFLLLFIICPKNGLISLHSPVLQRDVNVVLTWGARPPDKGQKFGSLTQWRGVSGRYPGRLRCWRQPAVFMKAKCNENYFLYLRDSRCHFYLPWCLTCLWTSNFWNFYCMTIKCLSGNEIKWLWHDSQVPASEVRFLGQRVFSLNLPQSFNFLRKWLKMDCQLATPPK